MFMGLSRLWVLECEAVGLRHWGCVVQGLPVLDKKYQGPTLCALKGFESLSNS